MRHHACAQINVHSCMPFNPSSALTSRLDEECDHTKQCRMVADGDAGEAVVARDLRGQSRKGV